MDKKQNKPYTFIPMLSNEYDIYSFNHSVWIKIQELFPAMILLICYLKSSMCIMVKTHSNNLNLSTSFFVEFQDQ